MLVNGQFNSCRFLLHALLAALFSLSCNAKICALADHAACALPYFSFQALSCVSPTNPTDCDPLVYNLTICVQSKWLLAYQCYNARGCDPSDTGAGKNCTTIFSPLCGPVFTKWICEASICLSHNVSAGCNITQFSVTPAPTTAPTAPMPSGSYPLPCVPCVNGVCNMSARFYYAPSDAWYGACICNPGYSGTQCELNTTASCANRCEHSGTCASGVCKCTEDFTGSACHTPQCLHQVSGSSAPSPLNASNMCSLPCQDGFGQIYCRRPVTQQACASISPGSTFSDTIWTSEPNLTMQCQSFDPGWVSLLGGDSYISLVCDHPSGKGQWNDTTDTSGRCRMDFIRYSYTSLVMEELFSCDVTTCNSRAYLPYLDQSSSYFGVGQSSTPYKEPSGAMALRLLLVCFSIIAGGAALLPFPGKDAVLVTLLSLTLFLLVMNVSEGATLNTDANRQNRSIASFTSATDPNVILQCQKTKCYCNPTAVGKPNCNGEMGTVVSMLKNGAKFTCNNVTKQCIFTHDDLFGGTFNLFMMCAPTNCVRSWPPPVTSMGGAVATKDNTAAIVVGTFGALFLLLIVLSIALHIFRMMKGQQAWSKYESAHSNQVAASPLQNEQQASSGSRELRTSGAAETDPEQDGGTQLAREHRAPQLTGAHIIVSHITYEVQPSRFQSLDSFFGPRPPRVIVNDVSLALSAGKMIAIMGPSGCGKTTLLDALCQREKMGEIRGDIFIDLMKHASGSTHPTESTPVRIGKENVVTFRHLLGYVADDDVILPSLTVFEALQYAAELRQPVFIPRSDKERFLNQLIRIFRLDSCRDTIIGRVTSDDSRGYLSQGERRRVAIAQHLVSLPRVLVLDEPTTGLDSYNARLVVQCLRDVARISSDSIYAGYYGHFYNYAPLILMTIHQPTGDMFSTFDDVCIMSQGRCIYSGPADAALPWFTSLGAVGANIDSAKIAAPDLVLEVASTLSEAQLDMLANAVRETTQRFLSPRLQMIAPVAAAKSNEQEEMSKFSQEQVNSHSDLEDERSVRLGVENDVAPATSSRTQRTLRKIEAQKKLFYPQFWTQVIILIRRGWRHIVHDGRTLALHFLVSTIITFIASFLYQNSGMDVSGILSKAGAITFYLLWLAVINLSALDLFLSERGTYIFETSSAAYSASAYYAAKVVLDSLLLRIIPTTIGGLLMYFQIGLRTDSEPLGYFLVVTILFSLVCSGLCTTIACVVPNFGVGILFNGFLLIFLFAFGGFMSQTAVMPIGLQWIRYVSPFYYAFEAIVVNQLAGQTCFFSALDPTGVPTTMPLPLACEQYIFNLGLKPTNFSFDIAMLGLWAGIYIVTSFLSLKYLVRGKR